MAVATGYAPPGQAQAAPSQPAEPWHVGQPYSPPPTGTPWHVGQPNPPLSNQSPTAPAIAHPTSAAPVRTGGTPATDPQVAAFDKYAQGISAQLQSGGYNQGQANDFYKQASAPIEGNFYQQANDTAAYLARQGLGNSGINISANSSLDQNRSALESQARLKSTDLARELQRRSLLDAFSTQAMKESTDLQSKGIDVNSMIAQMQMNAQMKMFEEQMQAQSDAGTGQFFGGLFNVAGTVGSAAILA